VSVLVPDFSPFGKIPRSGIAEGIDTVSFFEVPVYCFPQGLHLLHKNSISSTSLVALFSGLLIVAILYRCEVESIAFSCEKKATFV
jgi:hypothetical protein